MGYTSALPKSGRDIGTLRNDKISLSIPSNTGLSIEVGTLKTSYTNKISHLWAMPYFS